MSRNHASDTRRAEQRSRVGPHTAAAPNVTAVAAVPINAAVAISSAIDVEVIPVSYHSLATAMVMLAAVAVLWFIPPKRVLEMTRAKAEVCKPDSYDIFAIQWPIEELRLRFSELDSCHKALASSHSSN